MAVLKCKMCGGDLSVMGDSTVAECEYCGSKQTVPSVDNEKKITLFTRANRLRLGCEFDKASGVYESIVEEFSDEAEAYWGLVLCKYGIEYVDDPGTGKKVPTCHRSSFDSVFEDSDFEMVMEYSDAISRKVYREEAKAIEDLRVGIIEVSSKEEPYDIFICYKETAEDGQRTIDSVLAQDVYDELTSKGYKVFFSRITLEDKLGVEYEPYIFAALNSAKVMLAFGTDYDYYNAVWVKNEWSRFLALIAKGEKKTLIPCYKDIDAYDMPTEFKRLQAQDMGKVGAIQDLIRGIEKILGKKEKETVVMQGGNYSNAQALLKRGSLALEDREWEQADEFFEEVLNQDPECAEAYLGKLFALKHCCTLEELSNTYILAYNKEKEDKLQACEENIEKVKETVSMYAIEGYLAEQEIESLYIFDRSYISKLESIKSNKNKTIEQINKEKLWNRANQYAVGDLKASLDKMVQKVLSFYDDKIINEESADRNAIELVQAEYNRFLSAADIKVQERYEHAMSMREKDYNELLKQFKDASTVEKYNTVMNGFLELKGYRDSEKIAKQCSENITQIKEEIRLEEEQLKKRLQLEKERQAEEKRLQKELKAKKRKKTFIKVCIITILGFVGIIVLSIFLFILSTKQTYKKALEAYNVGNYELAETYFGKLGNYKDSKEYYSKTQILTATSGEVITIGKFQQSSYVSEPQDIEWIVLDVQDGKVLVISKYVLIGKGMVLKESSNERWENCDVRTWLNEDFYDMAFTLEEKQWILESMIENDYEADTLDKVFLLSEKEFIKYSSMGIGEAQATEWAKDNGSGTLDISTNNNTKHCAQWWLRSVNERLIVNEYDTFDFVEYNGTVGDGKSGSNLALGVRPVMWISVVE